MPAPWFVSLPMYWFAETAQATRTLGEAIARELTVRGVGSAWVEPDLPDHDALQAHWCADSLALSQSCGLPLVEALADRLVPVGTLGWKGVTDRGHYRSVIVSRTATLGAVVRPAVNDWHSLSGWASLGVFLGGSGLELGAPVVTGSHRASLAALQSGEADVAAIDAVTWALAGRYWPRERSGLTVVGHGPLVPSLPLVAPARGPAEAVKRAVRAALASPGGRSATQELGLSGFIPLGWEDFRGVETLAAAAQAALPRPKTTRRLI